MAEKIFVPNNRVSKPGDEMIQDVIQELIRAESKFPPMANLHEAYAVILEELDEVWEIVKLNQFKYPDRAEMAYEELVQLAAMVFRAMKDCCTED